MGRHSPTPSVRPWIIARTYAEGDSRWRGIVFALGVIGAAATGLTAVVLILRSLLA